MRRKSVKFFMARDDEISFINLVFSIKNVVLLNTGFKNDNDVRQVSNIDSFYRRIFENQEDTGVWYIGFKPQPEMRLHIEYTNDGKPYIGQLANNLIWFKRSVYIGNTINDGELTHAVEAIDVNGKIHLSDSSITKIYNKLARWIRNNGVTATLDGSEHAFNCYILPSAVKLYQQGAKLGSWHDPSLRFRNESFKPPGCSISEENTIVWRDKLKRENWKKFHQLFDLNVNNTDDI
jgi:hypothetical protein